ncbi:MAG: hypothetical protein IPF94_07220 [Betaproteobacteria bacterium]|nr:hypothetical protein [Betaproteobacteria bacterium]
MLDLRALQHRAGGLGGVAQIAKDLGAHADARRLARAAAHYEGAAVRRLGYLLEQAGHTKQAKALRVYAETARHFAPLDPASSRSWPHWRRFRSAIPPGSCSSMKSSRWTLDPRLHPGLAGARPWPNPAG